MKIKAISFGNELIELESQLDQWFANGEINSEMLQKQVQRIGQIKAQLRYVHFSTHLKQKSILTPHQIHLYDELRGYGSDMYLHNHSWAS